MDCCQRHEKIGDLEGDGVDLALFGLEEGGVSEHSPVSLTPGECGNRDHVILSLRLGNVLENPHPFEHHTVVIAHGVLLTSAGWICLLAPDCEDGASFSGEHLAMTRVQ